MSERGRANHPAPLTAMSKRLVEHNPFTGVTTFCDYNPLTDETTIISEFLDLQTNVDVTRAAANDAELTKRGIKGDFWWYASIPMPLIHKWLVEDGIDVFKRGHEKAVFSKVNSREFCGLKATTKFHDVKE